MCDTSFVVQCNFIIQPKKEKTSKNLHKIIKNAETVFVTVSRLWIFTNCSAILQIFGIRWRYFLMFGGFQIRTLEYQIFS